VDTTTRRGRRRAARTEDAPLFQPTRWRPHVAVELHEAGQAEDAATLTRLLRPWARRALGVTAHAAE